MGQAPYWSFSSNRSPEQRGHRLNQNINGYPLIARRLPRLFGPFFAGWKRTVQGLNLTWAYIYGLFRNWALDAAPKRWGVRNSPI